jgi:hypothetical protein
LGSLKADSRHANSSISDIADACHSAPQERAVTASTALLERGIIASTKEGVMSTITFHPGQALIEKVAELRRHPAVTMALHRNVVMHSIILCIVVAASLVAVLS